MNKKAEIQKYVVSGQEMNFSTNLRPSVTGNSIFSYNIEIGRIDRNNRTVAIHPKEGWILSQTTKKHVTMVTRAVAGLQGWKTTELKDPVDL